MGYLKLNLVHIERGAHVVTVTIVGNEHGDTSSNPS